MFILLPTGGQHRPSPDHFFLFKGLKSNRHYEMQIIFMKRRKIPKTRHCAPFLNEGKMTHSSHLKKKKKSCQDHLLTSWWQCFHEEKIKWNYAHFTSDPSYQMFRSFSLKCSKCQLNNGNQNSGQFLNKLLLPGSNINCMGQGYTIRHLFHCWSLC